MDEDKYRDLCSMKTIYSEKKGFFEDFIENMTDVAGDQWIEDQISMAKSDEMRLVNCFKNKEVRLNWVVPNNYYY